MSEENGTPKFEELVNDAVKNSSKDEKGNLVMPENVDDNVAYAARLEIRRRNTQSAYTKSQQRVKSLENENNQLYTSWEADAVSKLSNDEQARLEELKVQDPEAWRSEISKLEEDKRQKFKEKRTTISKKAEEESLLSQRELVLKQFLEDNPGLELTDEIIENDVPPRITKKLEEGKISFEDFLNESVNYLSKNKTIDKGEKPNEEPNFNKARGSSTPAKEAVLKQDSNDYKTEIF